MKNTDEALAKLIEKGIEVAEKSGEFVINQAPELLQQFFRWHIVANIFGALVGVLLFWVAYKVIQSFGVDEKDWDNDIKFLKKWTTLPVIITSFVLLLIGAIFFLCSIYELLFILTAPKIYLIEYFIKH